MDSTESVRKATIRGEIDGREVHTEVTVSPPDLSSKAALGLCEVKLRISFSYDVGLLESHHEDALAEELKRHIGMVLDQMRKT